MKKIFGVPVLSLTEIIKWQSITEENNYELSEYNPEIIKEINNIKLKYNLEIKENIINNED